MKSVELEETDMTAADLAKLARSGTVILMRKGKPLAAVRPLSDSDRESIALANNPRFLALIEESRRSYREEGGIGIDDVRAELGLKSKKRDRIARKRKKPAAKASS